MGVFCVQLKHPPSAFVGVFQLLYELRTLGHSGHTLITKGLWMCCQNSPTEGEGWPCTHAMPCSCRVTCLLLWCWWRFCWFVRVCGIMRIGRGGLGCIVDFNLALVGASGALCGLMSVVPMAVWSALGANANIEEIAHCCRQACPLFGT